MSVRKSQVLANPRRSGSLGYPDLATPAGAEDPPVGAGGVAPRPVQRQSVEHHAVTGLDRNVQFWFQFSPDLTGPADNFVLAALYLRNRNILAAAASTGRGNSKQRFGWEMMDKVR